MAIELEWGVIFGFAGVIITVVGGVIARDRQLTNMIHRNHEETAQERSLGDEKLHDRINRVRDEMSSGYVRRVDLDGHLQRLERQLGEMRQDMKEERRETNQRLDAVLAAIKGGSSGD
ncbi:hypothetical protein [Paracoccus phage vB_PmaS-R3]|uniref:Uncharacterized protein n=1 Tax=Paracoccus phage vB_PmaS-R3 TaxID=2494563 RepID=A0A0B5A0D7_9CAUD|nr:hypothetical protein VC48_gp33 [Paracoccus phage vB_PmaS-R3]AJD83157.1 hypothetical protein [Paracoccus phage vB_PmaS-R3]